MDTSIVHIANSCGQFRYSYHYMRLYSAVAVAKPRIRTVTVKKSTSTRTRQLPSNRSRLSENAVVPLRRPEEDNSVSNF